MLKREKFSKLPIEEINVRIAAHQMMIEWYHDYLERKGPYVYVDERIQELYNKQAEYLIAREMHIESQTKVL